MKKTVVEYITNTLEDIPKQSLQTNKRRLHAFFSEQETIEKRGAHFVFRYGRMVKNLCLGVKIT